MPVSSPSVSSTPPLCHPLVLHCVTLTPVLTPPPLGYGYVKLQTPHFLFLEKLRGELNSPVVEWRNKGLGEDSAYVRSRRLSPLIGRVDTIFRLIPVKHVYILNGRVEPLM
eukprot:4169533-Pyramimonas_sp.AAC.1